MFVRTLMVVLTFLAAARAEDVRFLEVLPDRFELFGVSYYSKLELVTALRALADHKVISCHYSVRGSDTAAMDSINAQLKIAEEAAHTAGIARVIIIGNEIW